MKKHHFLYFLFLSLIFQWGCYSCTPTPRIAIPLELKNELVRTGRYKVYVECLNKSLESNNPKDLSKFLSVEYFTTLDTGSEHGNILLEILRKKGDAFFLQGLKYLSPSEKTIVKGYLLIGIDNQKNIDINTFIKKYPKSVKCLNIEPW